VRRGGGSGGCRGRGVNAEAVGAPTNAAGSGGRTQTSKSVEPCPTWQPLICPGCCGARKQHSQPGSQANCRSGQRAKQVTGLCRPSEARVSSPGRRNVVRPSEGGKVVVKGCSGSGQAGQGSERSS
jgi:hypothetical protein